MNMEYEIQKIIKSPIALCTLIFERPFGYQAKFLKSKSNRIAFRSGRQVGKTTICSVKAIHHALNQDKAMVVILSPTQRQSSLMFRKVRAYLQNELLREEIVQESQTMIVFRNGSEIHSLPGNNPDTIRGFSPTLLIIDEAAFVKDDVYVAAEPSLAATNGQLIMTSTPFGKRGRFYNAFSDENFEKYHIPSIESPLITQDFLDGQRGSKTELEFKQEFEGEFLEEMDTYFPRELILSCVDDEINESDVKDKCDYYLGVDIARYGLDETTYTIAKLDNKGMTTIIHIESTSKKPLTDVMGRVKNLNELWNFRGVYIDESGVGAGAVDVLAKSNVKLKNLDNKKGGIPFTLQNKEEMYKNLKLMMETSMIKFPHHDKLIQQLSDMQYEYTEIGHTKLHHPDGGHDDYPDSLALSVSALIRMRYKPYISLR